MILAAPRCWGQWCSRSKALKELAGDGRIRTSVWRNRQTPQYRFSAALAFMPHPRSADCQTEIGFEPRVTSVSVSGAFGRCAALRASSGSCYGPSGIGPLRGDAFRSTEIPQRAVASAYRISKSQPPRERQGPPDDGLLQTDRDGTRD